MPSTSSAARSVTWAILLGLVTVNATPWTGAQVRFSSASCRGSSNGMVTSIETTVPAEECYQLEDSNANSIKVLAWPVCGDRSTAQLALHSPKNIECNSEDSDARVLIENDGLGQCTDLKGFGSFSFDCSNSKVVSEEKSEEADASKQDKTKEGGILKYPHQGCRGKDAEREHHLPDTCIDVHAGFGLSFTQSAVCANGTNAIIAGFKGKGCDPTSEPLDEPFTEWDDRVVGFCVPTEDISSMTFWCDGLEGVDMRKPNAPKKAPSSGNLGLILGLSIGFGGLFVMIMGFAVAYSINHTFRARVKGLFGHSEGYIAL